MSSSSSSGAASEAKPELFSVKIWNYQRKGDGASCVEVADFENLYSIAFFKRSTVRDLIKFASRTVVNHAQPGQRVQVAVEGGLGLCALESESQ